MTGSETYSSSEGVRGGGKYKGRRACDPLARLETLEASELRATLEACERRAGLAILEVSERRARLATPDASQRRATLEASELRAGPATLEASERGTGLMILDVSEQTEKAPGIGVVVGRRANTGPGRGWEREIRMDGGLRVVPEERVVIDDPAGSSENCTREEERVCDVRLKGGGKARRARRYKRRKRLSSATSHPRSDRSTPMPVHTTTTTSLVKLEVSSRSTMSRKAKAMYGSNELGDLARKWWRMAPSQRPTREPLTL